MRKAAGLFLFVLPLAVACGGDDSSGEDTLTTSPNTTGPGDGSGGDGSGDTAADGGPGGSSGGGAGGPTIDSVTWTQAAGCVMSTGSDVEVVVTATDPDNDASELTLEVMAIGCTTGTIDGLTATLFCPQLSPYATTATVSDPDGNEADIDFTIDVCIDGSAP